MMDTSITSESSRKVILEDLSREDLVKKCKSLLNVAQKAKQAKDSLQEENNQLKLKLKSVTESNPTEELIENLTQQKLALVTTIEELKVKNTALDSKLQIYEEELKKTHEKFSEVDNENVSYKRQVKRLTDENEQLLDNLESLEKQIEELNKIGIQQREQLLELEKSKIEEAHILQNNSKVLELQNMLRVSLEEVKKLKSESITFQENSEKWQMVLIEKDKNIKTIGEELQKCTKQLNELKQNKSDEKIAQLIIDKQKLVDSNKDLEENMIKLKEKNRLFHSKLVKFAGNAKTLKDEKNHILQIFKTYTDQVNQWKDQLSHAGQQLMTLVNKLEDENRHLKENCKTNEEMVDVKSENSKLLETVELLTREKEIIATKLEQIVAKYDNETRILIDKNEKENIELKSKLKSQENECQHLREELDTVQKSNGDVQNLLDQSKLHINELGGQIELFKNEIQSKASKDKLNENIINNLQAEMNSLQKKMEKLLHSKNELTQENEKHEITIGDLKNQIEDLLIEKQLEITTYKDEIEKLKSFPSLQQTEIKESVNDEINYLKQYIETLQKEIAHSKSTDQQLAERSSEEIIKLVQENQELLATNEKLQNKLEEFERKESNTIENETQTEGEYSKEYETQISNLKHDNAELLREMNEMNQVLKERGEAISKLEAHCEEVKKKLQVYETQANKNVDNISKKEEIIKKLEQEIEELKMSKKSNENILECTKDDEIIRLKNEIEMLKERLNSNLDNSYAESETMSTSTISKTEDSNRMRDLEGSWEERYGKLRNLAIKLKGKIREQTTQLTSLQTEKEDIQSKLSNSLKMIQTLQNNYDKQEDELEKIKKESQKYLEQLNSVAEGISKDKRALVSNDEIITSLKNEIEEFKAERKNTENWKKQVSAKVQTLRKELEAKNLLKKDFEQKIANLTADIEAKDKALKAEIESHKQTQTLLEQSKNDCKKNSVLNLEMQDYERSVKELTQKLEKKQEQINNLKAQVESQKSTINALREQNKILEERIHNEESDLSAASSELTSYKQKISGLEESIRQKEDKILSITQLLETVRSENEELSTELSKVIAEHQKSINAIKSERDHLRGQTMGLQQGLREAQDTLKLKEDELRIIQNDYENYKVRAQSVLRQNQNRDVALEEKLSEEVTTLKAKNDALNSELAEISTKIKDVEAKCNKLSSEKNSLIMKRDELEYEVEELKNQYALLSKKYQKALTEHSETVRSLKVHADTISQCYRQQIAEQEVRHNREIVELRSRLEKAPSPAEPSGGALPPPCTPREEGEGSESVDSGPPPSVHPVPLERLLGHDSDREAARLRKQLGEQETKVAHLAALLADTEQDLAKHAQMNKLLKEEIRRQQRSEEREKHAENLEYLKNVVFKFVTLNSGDERTRLVPVLNTILKLSPEEQHKLTAVARGDPGRGWSNYLPMWSSPSKPQ